MSASRCTRKLRATLAVYLSSAPPVAGEPGWRTSDLVKQPGLRQYPLSMIHSSLKALEAAGLASCVRPGGVSSGPGYWRLPPQG